MDEGLDVRAVVDRFRESETTLGELRERLRALVLAEEGAEHAAVAIEGAAQGLSVTAASLDALVAEMQGVGSRMTDALEVARRYLEGTDPNALKAEVAAAAAETKTGMSKIAAQISALSESIPKVEQARAELEAVKTKIPPRQRKKYGI